MSSIESLPQEIISEELLLKMDYKSIISFCMSDVNFLHFLENDSLWIKLIKRDFNVTPIKYKHTPSYLYEKLDQNVDRIFKLIKTSNYGDFHLKSLETSVRLFDSIELFKIASQITFSLGNIDQIYERIEQFKEQKEFIKDLFEEEYQKPEMYLYGNEINFTEYALYHNGDWINRDMINTIIWKIDDINLKALIVNIIVLGFHIYKRKKKVI